MIVAFWICSASTSPSSRRRWPASARRRWRSRSARPAGSARSPARSSASSRRARTWRPSARRTKGPINVNFFCHTPPAPEPTRIAAWRTLLAPYYRELGLDPEAPIPETNRVPFDDAFCALIEEARPEVVSFHFGLPAPALLDRVRATGARIISSATTVAEARWLEERGVRRDHRHGSRGRRPSRQFPLATTSACRWAPSRWCRRWSMR